MKYSKRGIKCYNFYAVLIRILLPTCVARFLVFQALMQFLLLLSFGHRNADCIVQGGGCYSKGTQLMALALIWPS